MSPQEQQARTILLAQALENADAAGHLVSLEQRQAATLAVLRGLQAPGGAAPSDEQLVAMRARRVLDLLPSRYLPPASLERPGLLWPLLALAVPLLALLAGIFTDRIADPHRVDLLSAPLLLIIGFNLLMYSLLALQALWRKSPAGAALLPRALQQLDAWRLRQRGSSGRVVAEFYLLWHALAGKLVLDRCKIVLHVSAAAWGVGIALSLALRGLSAEYRAGWESTFLDAAQVHRLLEIIFWLPMAVFRLMPLTLAEVDALRNFSSAGMAGARWVWMYVGLMVLLVVLPRLLLAAWAGWSARRISRQLRVPLDAPYFRGLLAGMRCTRLAIGLAFSEADDGNRARFLRLARSVADDPLAPSLAVSTPEGDLLQWIEEAGAAWPVDAVLCICSVGQPDPALPPAWVGRPRAVVSARALAQVRPQLQLICRTLAASLNLQTAPGFDRLANTLEQRQAQGFEQSMVAVAAYLYKVAAQLEVTRPDEAIVQAWDDLFLALQQLHCLDRTTGRALEQKLIGRYASPAVIGKTPAAAASAATGATVGVAIDASTGFMTLGAGAALGALLGAGVGWAAAAWRKKGVTADMMQRMTEAALLLYLEFAHSLRVHAGVSAGAGDMREIWQKQIAREVQQRKLGQPGLWLAKDNATQSGSAASEQLLTETLEAVLANLYPPARPPEIVGRSADF